MKKRKGYSIIEVVISLALIGILVLSLLPVLSTSIQQRRQLEELRLQNEFLQNVITCVNRGAAIDADDGRIDLDLGAGRSVSFSYLGRSYTVTKITEGEMVWAEIRREGMDETIRFLSQN